MRNVSWFDHVIWGWGEGKGRRNTYGSDSQKAKDRRENPRGNHNSPQRKPQSLNARSLLIQVPENVEADGDHGDTKEEQRGLGTEEWEVFREILFEEREFGDDKEEGDGAGDEVGDSVEEEELQ